MKNRESEELLKEKDKLIEHLSEVVKQQAEEINACKTKCKFADEVIFGFLNTADSSIKQFIKRVLTNSDITMQIELKERE